MLGPVAGALATPQWVAPVPVSDPGELNSNPQVAFDAQGEVILVWGRGTCSAPSGPPVNCDDDRIQAAIRPPGQPFGPVQTLAGDPGTPRADLPQLQLAADTQGGAVAVWPSTDSTTTRVRYAIRPPGQAFGSVQTIDDPGSFITNPTVAVDPAGNMIALWISAADSTTGTASYAVGTTSTGFGPAHPLPGDASAYPFGVRPQVAFAGGEIIAAWLRNESARGRIRVAIGSLQGFGEPQTISEDTNTSDSSLALGTSSQGDAAMVFMQQTASTQVVGYALRSPGQAFGAAQTIAANAGNSVDPQVAFAPNGRATAVWDVQENADHKIRYATREPGQSFGFPTDITGDPGVDPGGSEVAMDGQGNAMAVWTSFDNGTPKTRWASAPLGQGFGAPGTLLGPDQGAAGPEVAFDPQGNAVAAWYGYPASFSTNIEAPVLAAGFDAAGPLLRGLSLPSTGKTSQAVPFAVTPMDVWSPVASTRFSFGDGKALSAATVQAPHTYKSGRIFPVSVTSTDALGNSSSASSRVKITDNTKPRISRLTMTRRTFAVGPKRTPRTAVKKGSAFRYVLSERAKVTIRIERRTAGRRVGRKCRAPSPRLRRHKSCARYAKVVTLNRRARPAGRKTTAFSGRIGKKALPPGRYRATFRAVDAAGNRSAPRRITFRIVSG
jgi:hypothetical protein